jgi:hypothetical protein
VQLESGKAKNYRAIVRKLRTGRHGIWNAYFPKLGRPRRRWEDNIKMDLREIGIDGANWI